MKNVPSTFFFIVRIINMNNLLGLNELEEKIGYNFENKSLLKIALSHSSYTNECRDNKINCYERLEFLGDAVLELSVSEFLFSKFPDKPEGYMTKLRASLVCEPTLAFIARTEIDLSSYILLGKGEEATGGRGRDSIISDVFEAIIGAIYLDAGFDEAKKFINKYVLTDMDKKIEFTDSKTNLQEYAQEGGKTVRYELINEEGPAHDKTYYVEAYLGDKLIGTGSGKTKKNAEQHAAFAALKALKG